MYINKRVNKLCLPFKSNYIEHPLFNCPALSTQKTLKSTTGRQIWNFQNNGCNRAWHSGERVLHNRSHVSQIDYLQTFDFLMSRLGNIFRKQKFPDFEGKGWNMLECYKDETDITFLR